MVRPMFEILLSAFMYQKYLNVALKCKLPKGMRTFPRQTPSRTLHQSSKIYFGFLTKDNRNDMKASRSESSLEHELDSCNDQMNQIGHKCKGGNKQAIVCRRGHGACSVFMSDFPKSLCPLTPNVLPPANFSEFVSIRLCNQVALRLVSRFIQVYFLLSHGSCPQQLNAMPSAEDISSCRWGCNTISLQLSTGPVS